MNKQFCTYEIALKLKGLGFDEECFSFYNHFGELDLDLSYFPWTNSIMDIQDVAVAPLYQQIIEWLFEKHGLILLEMRDLHRNYNGWYFEIRKQKKESDKPVELYSHDFNYDTRMEALIAGIFKSIELINDENNTKG